MSYENPKLVFDEFGLPLCVDATPDVPLATCRQDLPGAAATEVEGESRQDASGTTEIAGKLPAVRVESPVVVSSRS